MAEKIIVVGITAFLLVVLLLFFITVPNSSKPSGSDRTIQERTARP